MGLLDTFFGNADQTQALGLLGAQMMAGNTPQGLLAANQHLAGAPDRRMKQQLSQLQLQEAQQKVEDAARQRAFLQNLPDLSQGVPNDLMARAVQAGAIPLPDYINSMRKDSTPLTVAPGASLVDRNTLKPVFTAPKEQTLPAAIQEYQFAQSQGYRGTFDQWDQARKRAGATSVNVGVNTDKSYFGNVAEGLAKVDVGAIDAGRSAPDRIASSRRVREVLATNPITGTGAEARLSLNKALATAGLIDGTNVANTEVLASTLASQTLDAIKTSGLGAGQGFTDKDRQFLERAKSGNIEMTPQALGTLADLNERAAVASIRRANSVIGKLRQSPQAGAMGQALDPIPEPEAPAKPAASKAFAQMPTANASNKGKFLTDSVTGKRYQSNGLQWVEVK